MKLLKNLKIQKVDNLISLAVFGSYGTEYWRDRSSDIDILVLMEKRNNECLLKEKKQIQN